jgi:RNA polymerase sigma-70 factor, ECF subfamily
MAGPTSSPTDRREAFEQEVLPWSGRLYSAARRLARGTVEAEDLVQETLLRAYRTFDGFERGTNARAWLFTILYSVVANRFRRQKRQPEGHDPEELERVAHRAAPGEDVEAAAIARASVGAWGVGPAVEAALRRLSEEQRQVVLLVDLEELSYDEAAQVLGCPIGTVRSRLARARRHLARDLAGRPLEPLTEVES